MNIAKKISLAVASTGLLATTVVPTFADTTLIIRRNGNGSTNRIVNSDKCKSTVSQTSSNRVVTKAYVAADTGNNSANSNTGGTNTIDTGKATADLLLTVNGGSNTANQPDCCDCDNGTETVRIVNNGNNSTNTVRNSRRKRERVSQTKRNNVRTRARVRARTGRNRTNRNTGAGNSIVTDNAEATLDILVNGGQNTLNP